MLTAVDSFWASKLGCVDGEMASGGIVVRSSDADRSLYILRLTAGPTIVSLPTNLSPAERARLDRTPAELPKTLEDWHRLLGSGVSRVHGPAWVGYGLETFPSPEGVRPLTEAERATVATLVDQLDDQTRVQVASIPKADRLFGVIVDDRIAAVSAYTVWGETVAHLAVLVMPERRRRGLGSEGVSAAARHGTDAGFVPQYRALISNQASVALAESLGFRKYAEMTTVFR